MVSTPTGMTVGLVTALPVECAAMQALIGGIRPLAAPGTDPNYYSTGALASKDPQKPHQVLITVLPQDGTRSAATVGTDLLRSFPELRVVIMVGIAGGIPAPHEPARHVRLGDVVVATEGIVAYDNVRTVDGLDQLRGNVQGVSQVLVRAARELQITAMRGVRPWEEWSGQTVDPALAYFARPADSTDILHIGGAVVDHPARALSGHPLAAPKVHYGAIASADRLLRDEKRRDELGAKHAVLAVEMEASGIAVSATMHGCQWLVVRGIADYCDAAKNDGWHACAALSAAAYVRALLRECRPFESPIAPAAVVADKPWPVHQPRRTPWDIIISLAELMLEIPVIVDDRGRQAVIDQLRPAIRGAVRRHPALRLDVIEMIRTCFDYNGGPAELIRAIVRLDAGSSAAHRLLDAVRSRSDPALAELTAEIDSEVLPAKESYSDRDDRGALYHG
jgi:nucleoside phosphorylase